MNEINKQILADDKVLAEMVRRLVEAFQPERIFLFGSKARGEADPNSDYNLLVLVGDEAPPERRRSRPAYQALRGDPCRCRCIGLDPERIRTPSPSARLLANHH
jgi:hypothetical protein